MVLELPKKSQNWIFKKKKINPIALFHKKLGMISTSPIQKGGYLGFYVVEKNSKHMGQIGELNNKTAQLTKLLQ